MSSDDDDDDDDVGRPGIGASRIVSAENRFRRFLSSPTSCERQRLEPAPVIPSTRQSVFLCSSSDYNDDYYNEIIASFLFDC